MFSVEKCPAVPGFEGVSPSSETENQGMKPERLEEPLFLKRITDGMIPKLPITYILRTGFPSISKNTSIIVHGKRNKNPFPHASASILFILPSLLAHDIFAYRKRSVFV